MAATGNSGILGLSFPVEASIPDTSGSTLLENLVSELAEVCARCAWVWERVEDARTLFATVSVSPPGALRFPPRVEAVIVVATDEASPAR